MDDEDEIDVLGDFNLGLESLLNKSDEQISSCYDGEHQLGLHCESQWIMESSPQGCWYDSKPEPNTSLAGNGSMKSSDTHDIFDNSWSDKERYLLEKGLELFGRSYSRLSQYIGTKSASQVKAYMKSSGGGWLAKSSVSTSSFGAEEIEFSFSELIDDMDIPASMEEVIAVVSTAQPTVIVPASQRDNTLTSHHSSNKKKCRRKKHGSCSKRSRAVTPKKPTNLFNAEDLKDVFISNKEQDSIVLPNGEEVIRIRHGSSLSENSDVDIDVGWDEEIKHPIGKQELPREESLNKEHFVQENAAQRPALESKLDLTEHHITEYGTEDVKNDAFKIDNLSVMEIPTIDNHEAFEFFIDDVGKEVSVTTEGFIDDKIVTSTEKDTQIFKGSLVTPSGKVMTVVVDDLPTSNSSILEIPKPLHTAVSKYMMDIEERLSAIYRLPPPTDENSLQLDLITQEEQALHTEFFTKGFNGASKYIKIRNHIIDCWKNNKPNYISSTLVREGLSDCGDVNLISRIHAYLEQKGVINFGCAQCHYINTNELLESMGDVICEVPTNGEITNTEMMNNQQPLKIPQLEKNGRSRSRKKKLPFEEINANPITASIENQSKRKRINYMKSGQQSSFDSKLSPICKETKKTAMSTGTGKYTVPDDSITRVKPEPNKIVTRGIKPVKLIHCKSYSVTNKAPYRIELEVTALVLVDVHSHLSPGCEVIGLLGGVFRPEDRVLRITNAQPCRTILSSNIHCDMCPVSQCESSELITSKGLSVVGWYHSHPNFDPSPSDTDVDTQNMLQSWFKDTGKPFVGLIISPYYHHSVSSYRCCLVKIENNGPFPYQIDVKVTNYINNNIVSLRQSFEAAYKTVQMKNSMKQSHIHKCLESVKHHLKKATPKAEEEQISKLIQEIRRFCTKP